MSFDHMGQNLTSASRQPNWLATLKRPGVMCRFDGFREPSRATTGVGRQILVLHACRRRKYSNAFELRGGTSAG